MPKFIPKTEKYFFKNYVTDGPFFIRTSDEKLHMLWSTYSKSGYVEAIAHSDTDELDGNWTSDKRLLYDHDGGHGMIFKDLQGRYWLLLYYPNTINKEHPCFIPLEYNGNFAIK